MRVRSAAPRPSVGRARRRSPSGWRRAAFGALGILCGGGSLLSAAGCGDRQVVVVSVTGRPDPVSGLGVYYRVDPDGGPLRFGGLKPANGIVPNYDLFGISLDRGVSGTLSIDVYAHQDGSPCIRSRGHADVALSGDPKQQAEVVMAPVQAACDTSFPGGVFPKNAKIWGSAIDDLWIVGDGGAIVRWNGVYLETVPLPEPLKMARPQLPNFRAVSGSGARNVWIVGDQGTVLRWKVAGARPPVRCATLRRRGSPGERATISACPQASRGRAATSGSASKRTSSSSPPPVTCRPSRRSAWCSFPRRSSRGTGTCSCSPT
ncbi:MAG: hypothetical protein U1A78_13760 [Polyangia bacterium]